MSEHGDRHERAVRAVEAELSDLFGRVRRQIVEAADRVSPGLPPLAYKTLVAVSRHEPVTAAALVEALDVDKSLLSRTIAQLEQLSLVARTPDPSDGRASLVSTTDDGAHRLAKSRRAAQEALATTLASWQDEDVETLAVLLRALIDRTAPAPFDRLAVASAGATA